MKVFVKTILIILLVAGVAGLVYWQMHKKGIIKDSIKSAIQEKTDSLYFISYDSSFIDEVSGSASFYNVSLQSDSGQNLLLKSNEELPPTLFNIHVGEVSVNGVDVAGVLTNERVAAGKIVLKNALIRIIKTGASKDSSSEIQNDTLELYKRITGKLNSIQAGRIEIVDAKVIVTDRQGKQLSAYNGINIQLNNFIIDEKHDYRNIVSYFVKDIDAVVNEVLLPVSNNSTYIRMTGVEYNAAKKLFRLKNLHQFNTVTSDTLIDLSNITIDALNTESFIHQQRLDAGSVSCDGGLITVYTKNKKTQKDTTITIELYDDFVENIKVRDIRLGNTKVVVKKDSSKNEKPFILNNLRFAASDIADIHKGSSIAWLIQQANWQLSADGISLFTKDNIYKITTGPFNINNAASTAEIGYVWVKPLITEKEFTRRVPYQQDLYNFELNKIKCSGIDILKFFSENELWIDEVIMEAKLKIFQDKTLTPRTVSKVGKYPHQGIKKLPFKFYIKQMEFKNSEVSYRERARKSGQVGDVNFSKLNATLFNITNVEERIKANSVMRLEAKTLFAKAAPLHTEWFLPLNDDTVFIIRGDVSGFNGVLLNPLIRPLGMASVEKGSVEKLHFNLKGTDYTATATVNFLYHDLKVEMLKKDDGDTLMEKKEAATFFANLFMKSSTKGKDDNTVNVENEREITRSFFNLVWKTIFIGIKQSAKGID